PSVDLETTVTALTPSFWKNKVVNDFEKSVFPKYPEIEKIKNKLYDMGALYASMTGSGAAVFGLFDNRPNVEKEFGNSFVWQEQLEK
ncbi:MAG TPA: 4-(cytidine 5'-diphospho)-2-C-methyl-D-erythritol kinase, partial [Bacteroidia bacterium]|nr:4-(cytidine 5'-diphospho)-2-C-methyl-D-erythritol kinase [Bacteroidia bacterium]